MATNIMKSAILPASRYKDDWLSHRNLKIHSSGVNYTTPGHSLNRRGHLCPGLPRKIGVPTILRTSRFSVTSLFFSLTRRGFKIQQFWCTAKNRSPLHYFSLIYIFITSQKGRCKTHRACIALKALLHSH